MKEKLLELHKNSYAPYSKFPVSAVVVCKDGKEFYGVNVEDASTRAGTCAERCALFSALAAGYKKGDFKEINIMVLENYHKTENQISNIIRLYTHLKRRDPPV